MESYLCAGLKVEFFGYEVERSLLGPHQMNGFYQVLFLVFFLSLSSRGEVSQEHILLGIHMNKTLVVDNLERAAVAHAGILRVRAVPPDKVLITGIKPGRTMVRIWSKDGREIPYAVTVVPGHLLDASSQRGEAGVVRVEIEFLEVDTSTSEKFGIRWPDVLEGSLSASITGTLNTSGLNYVGQITSVKGWIEQLVSEGFARFLAKPRLYVRLGEEVSFHSGGEFPVTNSTEKFGSHFKHVQWKPFGLSVKIQPESADLYNFSSNIEVEVSERDSSMSVEDIPAINRRKLITKMNSMDGETVILSGLIRQLTSRNREGVTWLSSIPLIGDLLFSRRREFRQENEILLVMTLSFRTRSSEIEALETIRKRLEGVL